jgi:hypothetical protein
VSELAKEKSTQTYMFLVPKIIEILKFPMVDVCNDQMTFYRSIRIATSEMRLTMAPEK